MRTRKVEFSRQPFVVEMSLTTTAATAATSTTINAATTTMNL